MHDSNNNNNNKEEGMSSTTNGTSNNNTNGITMNTIQLPPTTTFVIGLCCVLYCLQVILDIPIHTITLCPKNVLYNNEYYRIITNCLFHGSLMHIGMNLMSGYPLLIQLEKLYGTIRLLLIILWSILLTSCVYIIIAFLLSITLHYTKYMYQHSIGFSGVLFHLLVLECSHAASITTQRSIFGFVTVSTIYYPWILLFLIQLLMPNASFLGHFSGIVVGTIQSNSKIVTSYLLPTDTYLTNVDNSILSSTLVVSSSSSSSSVAHRGSIIATLRETYVRTTPTTPSDTGSSTGTTVRSSWNRILQSIRTKLYNGMDTIYVTVFGRGNSMNSNVLLFSNNSRSVPSGINNDEHEEQLTTTLLTSSSSTISPNNISTGRKLNIQDTNNDENDRMLV